MDVVEHCISRIVVDAEAALDQSLARGVTVKELAPSTTGFPKWRRREDYVYYDGDHDRGHADWLVPHGATAETPRILYFHGGGYEWYSPQDVYRPCTTRLAKATGMPVLAIDYRLSPEFRAPTALEDARQGFEWIAENGPFGPAKASAVFLAGDSSGGGLALALAVHLRDHPAAGARVDGVSVVSPETDLTCSGESYKTRRWTCGGGPHCDPMFREVDPAAASMPTIYRLLGGLPGCNGAVPPEESELSPLQRKLHGLPPMQIHVGDREVMLSDSVDFAAKAEKANSPVDLHVWPEMWHTFTQYTEGCGSKRPLQQALDALQQQGAFLKGIAKKLGM